MKRIPASYDIIGNIAILKFPKGIKEKDKKIVAKELLKQNNINTALEKIEKVKGRLRTIKTKLLAGKNTRETIHKENSCYLKLNIEECYFSPRLSNERLEVSRHIKRKDNVLVMFAGVSPFPIVLAKLAKPKKVLSIELGRKCCKYGKENVDLNKLKNLEIIQGDVKKVVPKLAKKKVRFNKIVMPRPQLKGTFLKQAFSVSKKGTIIFYYGFNTDPKNILKQIQTEAKKAKKKIKILKIKKAGEIAPYKYRWRVDLQVVS